MPADACSKGSQHVSLAELRASENCFSMTLARRRLCLPACLCARLRLHDAVMQSFAGGTGSMRGWESLPSHLNLCLQTSRQNGVAVYWHCSLYGCSQRETSGVSDTGDTNAVHTLCAALCSAVMMAFRCPLKATQTGSGNQWYFWEKRLQNQIQRCSSENADPPCIPRKPAFGMQPMVHCRGYLRFDLPATCALKDSYRHATGSYSTATQANV